MDVMRLWVVGNQPVLYHHGDLDREQTMQYTGKQSRTNTSKKYKKKLILESNIRNETPREGVPEREREHTHREMLNKLSCSKAAINRFSTHHIVNVCVDRGPLPSDLERAGVIPVFTKGV
ncbi:hypothetical protein INR49_017428 [Caranx melampygus]|nr:hypothetical protein INR49_017428 [Caranx melampygus]